VTRPPDPLPGARLLFSLDPAVAHLNHGSLGAVPIVVQRVQQRLRDEMESNPVRFFDSGLLDRVTHTRRHLAAFLGAEPDGAALVTNATAGLSIVLRSIDFAAGDEVVMTDHAYGTVPLAVREAARRHGVVARTVEVPLAASDADVVARVRAALGPRTRLLIVDHITAPTARLLPVVDLVGAAHARGVAVMVDGAHAPGMLPLELAALGADFWVGNLHKWGFAPRGTALLYVAPPWRDRIEPPVVSWDQDSGFPIRVESQGTLDYTAWLAAPTGLFTLRTLGLDEVRRHNAALAAYGQAVVGEALGLAPADLPYPGGPDVCMRIVPLPRGIADTPAGAVTLRTRIADELATNVAVNTVAGRGYLRLSGQVYNRAEEYDRLAAELPKLLARTADRAG
jgi:isopenicillin-N epimerase